MPVNSAQRISESVAEILSTYLGFSKAQMAREYRLAQAGMKGGLAPDGVAEALRQLDLQQLKDYARAWATGTPWTGV
jgi:hypothetical protein